MLHNVNMLIIYTTPAGRKPSIRIMTWGGLFLKGHLLSGQPERFHHFVQIARISEICLDQQDLDKNCCRLMEMQERKEV